jgi:hypothetical protein
MLGFHSQMAWLPEHGLGMTLLTNADAGVLLRGPLLRKMLELAFDGQPEADARLRVAIANHQTELAQWRGQLTHPVPAQARQRLAARYRSPELGSLRVVRKGQQLHFQFQHWRSEVALRRHPDGSLSFKTIDPGVTDIEFVLDDQTQPAALVLRDAQHEYRFVASSN